MAQDEAQRLHDGLRRSIADLLGCIDDAWIEDRAGYRLLMCPRIPVPALNGIWVEGPEDSLLSSQIETAIDEYRKLGKPCSIAFRAGRTRSIERLARRLGFSSEESIPGMVVQHHELASIEDSELEITRARQAVALDAAATIAAAGFEAPRDDLAALFTPRVADLPGLSIYVGVVDDQPVSTATAWVGEGSVGVFNVATLPGHRGRGYGRAITLRAIIEGFTSGANLAWLQASSTGEPVYRAMGFRQVETYLLLGEPSAA